MDVDIKWFKLEQEVTMINSGFAQHALVFQYLYILFLCIIGKAQIHKYDVSTRGSNSGINRNLI